LGEGFNRGLAIFLPEITFAPVAALGAVYCTAQYAPKTLKNIEGVVSKYIVEPHLELFERGAGALQKAREEYDKQKREEMAKRGEKVPEKTGVVQSRQERADVIADVVTKGTLAFVADFGATLLGQRAAGHMMGVQERMKKRTVFFEAGTHLTGVALMAWPFAKRAENWHYGISHGLQHMGMSKEKANDAGIAIPYIVTPGLAAALASVLFDQAMHIRGR